MSIKEEEKEQIKYSQPYNQTWPYVDITTTIQEDWLHFLLFLVQDGLYYHPCVSVLSLCGI